MSEEVLRLKLAKALYEHIAAEFGDAFLDDCGDNETIDFMVGLAYLRVDEMTIEEYANFIWEELEEEITEDDYNEAVESSKWIKNKIKELEM